MTEKKKERAPKTDRRKMLDARRELRETRGYLIGLVAVVEQFISGLDAEMKQPSDEARGRRIAASSNALEMTKDLAKRFGLGVTK